MSARNAHSRPPGGSRFAVEVLDIEALRERADHDEPFVVELLEDFLCRGVAIVDLDDAAEVGDFERLGMLAHDLKAALVSLGATSAASAAGQVELRAATLAIAREAPDSRAVAAIVAALLELDQRFQAARDAMRRVMDEATSHSRAGCRG